MAGESAINIEQNSVVGSLRSHWIAVPRYQRDYAWEKREVTAYLDDITTSLLSDDNTYFLGTIVTIRRNNDNLEVVDGQQRLATTALTLAAMRDVIGDSHKNFSDLIADCLSKVNSDTLESEPKIKLNIGDNPVFESLIKSGIVGPHFKANRDSHQNLKQSYDLATAHFTKSVSGLNDEARLKWLQNWFRYLEQRTTIILMKVATDTTAFRMFETLNDRGLEVTRADLIKNYIFGKADEHIEEIQAAWSGIREMIEADDKNSLMNYIWHALIVSTGTIEQKNIYDRVKDVVKGKQSAFSIISDWGKMITTYVALSNPESSRWHGYPPKISEAIKSLNTLNIQPFRPLQLAIAEKFSKNEAANAFEVVVSVGVRLLIASRTTTQSVFDPLSQAAFRIWKGEITSTKELVKSLALSIPSDQVFVTAFRTATVSKSELARYYLRALTRFALGNSTPSLVPVDDHEKLNLEHVLPLRPQNNWPTFSAEDVSAYSKRIGNLALLETKLNSEAKSDSFSKKRHIYARSKLPTTEMIAHQVDWTVKSIESRQEQLADMALKTWPLK